MKKVICYLLSAVLCLLMFAGCGNQNENVDVLKEMVPANATDALQLRYGKVAYSHVDYYADGSMESYSFYKDQERHVSLEGSEYVRINEDGEVYGFDYEEGKAFRYLFIGNYYEENYDYSYGYLNGYMYEEGYETILTQVTENGIIDIDTEITDKDLVNEDIVYFGYEEDSATKLLVCYEVEEETYVINKMTTTAVFADGTQKLLSEVIRVKDVETYVVDENVKKAVFEGKLQTLTVTVDAGTDTEKVYTQTISKGNCVKVRLPDGYDEELYLDAEYTSVYEEDIVLESDLHIYVRSKAIELTNEQVRDAVGGLNSESINLNYGSCPECNTPLEEPKSCSKCDWSFSRYLYSCPQCGQFDENRNSCSKCGWEREYTGRLG